MDEYSSDNKKIPSHTKGRDVESRGTTQFTLPVPTSRRQAAGSLEGCNGANRPTLYRRRLNYQTRRARHHCNVFALQRHISSNSLSGRVLRGEFTRLLASDFHHRRLSFAGCLATGPLHRICEVINIWINKRYYQNLIVMSTSFRKHSRHS